MTPSPPLSPPSSSTLPPANDTENAILRRKRRSASGIHHSIGSHIVYKRAALESESDYGKADHFPRWSSLFPIVAIAFLEREKKTTEPLQSPKSLFKIESPILNICVPFSCKQKQTNAIYKSVHYTIIIACSSAGERILERRFVNCTKITQY